MRSKFNFITANKDQVFKDLEKTFNQIGAVGLLDVKQDSPLVRAVDQVLQHGLRDPIRGYWSLVRSLTHSTTLKSLEAFVKYISSSNQKGLAWTFYTMQEGSLEYYLASLLQDTKVVEQHYMEQSLLRDSRLALCVVSAISTLRAEAAVIQASMESSLVSEGPLESTPFVTSPVDSGVALIDSDIERSEERQLATSVATAVSSSSENTLADESDRHNSNFEPPTASIMAQTNKYDGVPRRPRKKKKSESGKRVSFHQDSNDDTDIPITLRHPSNLNRFYIEGRYSWAGEGDSFFMKENNNFREVKSEIYERKGLSSSISIFESELGIEADCDSSTTTLEDTKNNIEIVCEKLSNAVKQSLGLRTREKTEGSNININARNSFEGQKLYSMSERGVPEGQEDPGVLTEYERLLTAHQNTLAAMRSAADLTSDSEWSFDTPDKPIKRQYNRQPSQQRNSAGWPSTVLQEAPSKTSLVKRFLRSIPTRKPCIQKKPVPKPRPSLYIKGAKPDPDLAQDLLDSLKKEMEQKQSLSDGEDEVVTDLMKTAMKDNILMNKSEHIYKVYRVAAVEGEPLLAVLTDSALYMVGLDSERQYCRRHHITYQTLNTVVIGPEYQTVMLVSDGTSRVTVTVVSALGQALVTHMITHLAVAVHRAVHTQLSVVTLSLAAMPALCRALASQTSITKGEQLLFYRYIRVEDSLMGQDNSLSNTKGGHLMYRPHNHSPWLPGYIVLKGGTLLVFSDVTQQFPKHVLSLECGYFGGCRRVFNSNRPHTFEILPFSQRGLYGTFQFAAADDYESSEWLQAFIQTSSALCQNGKRCRESLVGCGLLLTTHHLLTLDFPDTVLSWVRVQDISSLRVDTTCCILETSCREVQESGGDWILYFLTEQATVEFLDKLYSLRPELNQADRDKWTCEALHSHCVQTSQLVRTAWDPLLNPSHSTILSKQGPSQ